jgi:SAM-dependent methyltransferase
MRNCGDWRPSKIIEKSGAWVPSRDTSELSASSRFITALFVPYYESAIKRYASGHLLDLGCGKVPYFGIYRNLISRSTCTDWLNPTERLSHIDVVADLSASHLPFKENTFDTVLATDVLEHIARPEALVNEMGRVLRLGGFLILAVPFFYWIHEAPHDYYRFTEYALRRFCKGAGLTLIEIKQYGGAPEIVLDIFLKNLVRLAPWSVAACSSLASGISRSYFVRRISNWVTSFPLGYCLVAQKLAGAEGYTSAIPGIDREVVPASARR